MIARLARGPAGRGPDAAIRVLNPAATGLRRVGFGSHRGTGSLRCRASLVYSNASFLDNPQHAREALMRQEGQHAVNRSFDYPMRLAGQAQHDNAGVTRWRILLDIGKVEVECDQGTRFSRADFNDACVALAAERLLDNGVSFVSGGSKNAAQCGRQIFVELELQAAVGTTRSRANSAA